MSDEPKIDGELISVFDTEQESEAMVVQGLLTSVGIDSIISSLDAVQDVFPVGGVQVRVNPAQVEQARQIIAEYATADVDVEEVEEEDGDSSLP
jgi:hypothetical protein